MLIKIIALGFVGTFLALILKKYNRETVPFLEIAVIFSSLLLITDYLSQQGGELKRILSSYSQADELFLCLIKGAAITVLTKLSSEVCRESGNGLMAQIIELGGRVMLVVLSLPFITKITEIALSFLK